MLKKIILFSMTATFAAAIAAGCNVLPSKDEDKKDSTLLGLLALAGLNTEQQIDATVSFALADDNSPATGKITGGLDCSANLTVNGNTVTPKDLRFYVSAVKLIKSDDTTVDVTLKQNDFQYEKTALIDFEDAHGTCTGDNDVNTSLSFTAPAGSYKGIQFEVSVDPQHNTVYDGAKFNWTPVPPKPLNKSSMYWTWTGGYKFAKIELTKGSVNTLFHPGATNCSTYVANSGLGAQNCAQQNRAVIRLTKNGFDPNNAQIVLNLKKLFQTYNFDDGTNGGSCMPAYNKSECVKILNNLGLTYSNSTPTAVVTATPGENSFELR